MKKTRFILSAWYLIFLVFACKEKEKQSSSSGRVINDSLMNARPDNSANPYAGVDISPMDMSYYPVDYPKLKMTNIRIPPPIARVIYSRPHLQGRELFHNVLKYREPWRLGANESTEIQFFRDISIQGKKIEAGRYILYCILGPDKWDFVINSNIDSWGLTQDTTKNIQHFEIPITHCNPELEYFTMVFEKSDSGANLIIAWDDVLAKLPLNF